MIGLETIIGGAVGAVSRLIPEILKFMDAKNERAHELAMQDKLIEGERVRGAQKIEEIGAQGRADFDEKALDALIASTQAQAQKTGFPLVDAFSALMRPLITFQWVILLYPGVIIATFVLLIYNNIPVIAALNEVFGPEEKAIASGIINFWLLTRIFDRVNRP